MVSFVSLILASVLLCAQALAAQLQLHDSSFVPEYSLHVTQQDVSMACRSRSSAVVNGTLPGPVLTLQENRTTWVRVYNDMESQNLTMHWHGLSQSVAQFSDGTPQASQWPIPAGHFFDYEIHPSIGEAGTYFYHSHVGFQASTAAGPLIVEEASGPPPYDYAAEKIIYLSEAYNKTDEQIVSGVTAPLKDYIWSGEAEQVLVNGKSFAAIDNQTFLAVNPPYGPTGTSQTNKCQPEVFQVEPDTTYRFRAIGGLASIIATFGFEDHDSLQVISADGSYTKPAETDRMIVGAGQRIDFLLKTKSAEELQKANKTNFWMQIDRQYRIINATSYAILQYTNLSTPTTPLPTSEPVKPPITLSPNGSDWLSYTLQPLTPNNFPAAKEVTRTVYLSSAQLGPDPTKPLVWSINNHTWTEDNEHLGNTSAFATAPNVGTPYLVQIYQQGEAAIPDFAAAAQNGGWDADKNVYAAEVGEVIDIVLLNEPNGQFGGLDTHPWHIHGGHVWDLGSGMGAYNATANEARFRDYTPVQRDTTLLFKYDYGDMLDVPAYSVQGWRAWRLRVDNAGVWMVHCHTLQHMAMGMQSVWVMGNASEITRAHEPYVDGYLAYGGSAYGNASYDPLVMHTFD